MNLCLAKRCGLVCAHPQLVVALLCMAFSACGGSATAPSAGPSAGYTGEWVGTTSLGTAIRFVVSGDQRVVEIVAGYRVQQCSGTKTFADVNAAIGSPPDPARAQERGFGYGSPTLDGSDSTQVAGIFTSPTTAVGSILFLEFPGCGTAFGQWTASRR